MDESGLWLCGEDMRMRGDFARLIPRLRPHALARELLVKAARVKGVERPPPPAWERTLSSWLQPGSRSTSTSVTR